MTPEHKEKSQAGNRRHAAEAMARWNARREEIAWLSSVQELSQDQIAAYYAVTQGLVGRWMRRLGIPTRRTGAQPGRLNPRYKDGSQSRQYRLVIVKDKCAKCGDTKALGIHHVNGDHYDNRLANLQVLCNSCHMSQTKRLWWKAKREGLPLPHGNGPVGWKRNVSPACVANAQPELELPQ